MKARGSVVISGASTGIGRTCALYLDQLGFEVFAGVRREEDGQALQAQASARLRPFFLEITRPADLARAAEQVTGAVGSQGLAGLVNNAGIALGGPLEFVDLAELRHQFEINVVGQVALTQAFLPLLRQGRGRLINMSSISGRVAMPFFGPYSASKFALEALTDALRLELQPWGIAVISIQPGAIVTPIWSKSLAKADQAAAGLSPEAHQLYGTRLARLRQAVQQTAQRGLPAEAVARTVATALTAKRPKTRYLVGLDAKMAAFAFKILPDRWRDWLIRRNS
jgi:NAD(P)-dependent dehydrogenase (short-subunit alcohol dehydrogenase family)